MQHFFLLIFICLAMPAYGQENSIEINLTHEVTIQDSDEQFIQNISDGTITLQGEGDILFTSSRENVVYVFGSDGTFKQTFGNTGRGPGEFNRPIAIETGPDGNLYIVDQGNSRISVWSSHYEHITEFTFSRGWNTHFKRNNHRLFMWTQTFRPLPNGNFALTIHEIKKDPWRLDIYRSYEYEDYTNQHEVLSTWSQWLLTEKGHLVATEGTEKGSYHLYILNENGKILHTFGKEVEQPFHTEEKSRELNQLLQMDMIREQAQSGGTSTTSINTNKLAVKPYFINIEKDNRDYLWVHRNKEFGQQEEIDIYTLDGEYLTMVTLPPTDNEYKMIGIYGEKILFHVTDPDAAPSLRVYRIEYL